MSKSIIKYPRKNISKCHIFIFQLHFSGSEVLLNWNTYAKNKLALYDVEKEIKHIIKIWLTMLLLLKKLRERLKRDNIKNDKEHYGVITKFFSANEENQSAFVGRIE